MSFIKLDRKLLSWGWKDKPNMVALWIEILLQANAYENEWHGQKFECGSFPTSIAKLSKGTGLTPQEIRTCLNRLKSTNEITIESTSVGTKIKVVKWAEYQGKDTKSNKRNNKGSNKRSTNDQQHYKKEKKEENVERDTYKDVLDLELMGFTEETNKLKSYISRYHPSHSTYLKIKEAVFDSNIRHLDQYVKKIMEGEA